VEDDQDLREALSVSLKLASVDFMAFESAEQALPHVQAHEPQLLITDFRLPGMNGLELMRRAMAKSELLRVVVMTAYADTQLAIEALRGGARDFLVKPFQPRQLLGVIERNSGQAAPRAQGSAEPGGLVAQDPATQAVLARLQRVAHTNTTVLLTGESGVGKDVLAR